MSTAKTATAVQTTDTKPAAVAATKEPKMATKEAPKIDYNSMSVADLNKLVAEISARAKELSQKEFDETINFLVNDKLPHMGRTNVEAVFAIHTLMSDAEKAEVAAKFAPAAAVKVATARKPRAANGTAPKKPDQPFVRGTTYVDPKGEGKEWTAGIPGAKPKWLADAVEGLDFAAAQAKYAEFAKK